MMRDTIAGLGPKVLRGFDEDLRDCLHASMRNKAIRLMPETAMPRFERVDGKLLATGQVPSRATIEQAKQAARQCVINAMGAIHAIERSLDHLVGVVRIGAFVSSDTTFTQQPQVANGASELLLEIFGDAGKHVRAAVGVNTLPLDASVEVEFIFQTS